MNPGLNEKHAEQRDSSRELSEAPPGDAVGNRDARLREYLESSLLHRKPLVALLGAATSELMRFEARMAETILNDLRTSELNLERLDKLRPMMDIHLRYLRQIDRFTQLAVKTEECERRRDSE